MHKRLLFKELARLAIDGYVAGIVDARDEIARASDAIGDSATKGAALRHGGVVAIPLRIEKEIAESARVEAGDWCNEIESRCRRVLLNWHGSGRYDRKEVGKQLGALARDYLEDTEEVEHFAARRRMKVRDKDAHRKWQETKLPHVQYIKNKLVQDVLKEAQRRAKDATLDEEERRAAKKLADRIKASPEGKAIIGKQVKARHQTVRMRTGWNRWYNRGVVERAAANAGVVYLQWTTKRDDGVCDTCVKFDGLVVDKADENVSTLSPPLHYACRCRWLTVTKEWADKEGITPSAGWPDAEVDPAFGNRPTEGTETKEQGAKFHEEGQVRTDFFERARDLDRQAVDSGWAKEVDEGDGRARIAEWTGGKYKKINERIVGGVPSDKDLQLLDILSRAPEVTDQIVYRGVRQSTIAQSPEEAMAPNVSDMLKMRWDKRVGTTLQWDGLSAASTDPAVAGNFGRDVVLEIRAKSARWIGARGSYADEAELVFMPKSGFRIIGVRHGKIEGEQDDIHERLFVLLEQL